MGQFIDRQGRQYGRLKVIGRDSSCGPASEGRRVYWVCQCTCGNVVSRTGHELASGDTSSCGCLRKERIGNRSRTHGMTGTATYRSWQAAKDRCINPNNDRYSTYGAKGVRMCDRWLNSFEAFLADMGKCPKGHSIDRIDPFGNYEPSNCRWLRNDRQSRNKRNTAVWNGRRYPITQVAKELGLPRTSLNKHYRRLNDMNAAIAVTKERMKR